MVEKEKEKEKQKRTKNKSKRSKAKNGERKKKTTSDTKKKATSKKTKKRNVKGTNRKHEFELALQKRQEALLKSRRGLSQAFKSLSLRSMSEVNFHDVMNAAEKLAKSRTKSDSAIDTLYHLDLETSHRGRRVRNGRPVDFIRSLSDLQIPMKSTEWKENKDQKLEQEEIMKQSNNNDDDEDLDEDGLMLWPKAKLTSDQSMRHIEDEIKAKEEEGDGSEDEDEDNKPIHQIYGDDQTSLSSVSLSAIFQGSQSGDAATSRASSDRTLLAVFADDTRFSKRGGLIVFDGNNDSTVTGDHDDDPFIYEYRKASSKADSIDDNSQRGLGWVGGGLNRMVKTYARSRSPGGRDYLDNSRHNSFTPRDSLHTSRHSKHSGHKELPPKGPKYAQYVDGPPPRPRIPPKKPEKEEKVFDARPPPIDEIVLDGKHGETPEKRLLRRPGDRVESSVGIAHLRRLRRLRRGRETILPEEGI